MCVLRAVLLSTVLIVSLCLSAWPQSASEPPSGKSFPPDVLAYFSGDWSGEGIAGSGDRVQSGLRFARDLENQCLLVREKEKPPQKYQWMALWSVDSVSGDLIMQLTSNGNWGARVFRSRGWRDGKIVFQSVPEFRAAFGLERFTFERKSDTVFDTSYELSRDNGRTWLKGERDVYTRVSAP